MLNISEKISVTVPTWDYIMMDRSLTDCYLLFTKYHHHDHDMSLYPLSILVILQEKIPRTVFYDMPSTKAKSQWGLFLEMWLCSRCLSQGHGEPGQANFGQDQWNGGDDLGNQDLFRQYYRDNEMSEDDDPFLLIRGRFVERKGLLPPPLLRQWWGFHVCVGSWRYDGTCILFGIRQGYRDLSFGFAQKRGTPKLLQSSLFIIL